MYAIVELHDVSPYYYDGFCSCLDLLNLLGIGKYSLLVVPNFHGRHPLYRHADFVKLLRSLGQEIVLHGYTHSSKLRITHLLYTYGEGEFGEGGLEETYRKVEKAIDTLHACGLESSVFVPPAWLSNPFLEDILYAFDFVGVGYRERIKDLQRGESIPSRVLTLSNRHGLSYLSIKSLPLLYRLSRKEPILRIALHMRDFKDRRKMVLWRWLLKDVKSKRRLISYGELLRKGGPSPSLQSIRQAGWLGEPALGLS